MSNLLLASFEDENELGWEFIKRHKRLKKEASFAKSIFEFYRLAYYQKEPRENSIIKQKIHAIVITTIWCIQIASLLWIPHLQINNWDDNNTIWELFGYLRLDNACSYIGAINVCIYISLGIIWFYTFAVVIVFALIYKLITIPEIIISIIKKMLYILSNFLFIPIVTLLCICLKYNFGAENASLIYKNNKNAAEDLKAPIEIQIGIVLTLVVYYFMVLANAIFSSDIRHSIWKMKLKSKAHSNLEINFVTFTFLAPIIYSILAENNIIYFQIMFMIASGIMAFEALNNFPYFNTFMNILEVLKFSIIQLISFAFIFGKLIDNSLVIPLFVFLIIPILGIIIIRIISSLIKKKNFDVPFDPKRIENIYILESKIRPIFCSNNIEAKEEILYFLGNCYNCSKLYQNKLLAIWETNYCIFTLNDEALAKIKLGKAKYSCFCLEGCYQEYLCKHVLSEFDTNESIEYLNYFQKIHDAKKEDEILCVELLDFWKEIVSIKPNLKILDDLLRSITESISYLDEEYSQLHLTFPKCKEVLMLYSSFSRNILCDIDKSTFLEHKMRSIDKFANGSSRDTKSLSFFDEENGIILGLAEPKKFGLITFANQRASEILKCSINGIIGNKLQFFIPPPYDSYTDDAVFSSLQYVAESEIKLPKYFFLQLPSKYIVECKGKASISYISDHLIFILVFKKRNSSHQFALISDKGEIYSHSERFSHFLGKTNNNLRGHKIKDLLPTFQKENIKPFIPYHLSYIDAETYLILCHTEFYSVNLNYILIINDPEEIEAWRRGEFDEFQQSKFIKFNSKNKISLSFILSLSSDNSDVVKRKKTRKQTNVMEIPKLETHIGNIDSTEVAEDLSGKSLDEEKHSNKSDNTSQHFALQRIVNLSSRSIKIFHVSLIFAMLIVMATNTIVLIYTSTKVISESDINMQITLGNTEKVMESIALFSRAVHVLALLGGSQELIDYSLENFKIQLNLLQEIHKNITENLLEVHKCLDENPFVYEAIHLWDEDGLRKKKTNLVDAVQETISKGYDFIRKVNENESLETEIQYFVRNGGDKVFKYCNNTLWSLSECEIQDINVLKTQMDILLAVGFGTLVICLGFTLPFALAVVNMENKFWNLIKEHTYINYIELKQACLDRLTTAHGKIDILFSDGNQISKNSNLKNYRKFSWRICVYLILALAFFLVNILYLYNDCISYLHLRPSLLKDLINNQALYKALWIWSSEVTVIGTLASLVNNTAKAYPFQYPKYQIDDTLASISFSDKAITNSKYFPLLSHEFKEKFYEKCQSSNFITNHGVYIAGEILAFEAYYLDNSHESNFLDFWFSLTKELEVFNEEYDILIKLADHDSQNLIESQLQWIIAALICFCILSVIMYLKIFLSFFIKEKKYLEKMREMSKIIPDQYFKY